MNRVLLFVSTVVVAAMAATTVLTWDAFFSLPPSSLRGLGIMILLGLIAERLSVETKVGESGSTTSVAFLPLLATVILFGPASAVVFLMVTSGAGNRVFRRKPLVKSAFNISQHALAAALGGIVFVSLGGTGAAAEGLGLGREGSFQWIPLLAFGFVYMTVNHALVSRVVSLASHIDFLTVWRQVVGKMGGNFLYDLMVSPVAVAIALMGIEFGELGLVLASLPLLVIRNTYHTAFRLQQANRDLLSALVKAIETRDPYTSGHSVRVAQLAVLVAERLGMSQRQVELLEQSALLHDVGKIDAIYTDILRKSESLTEEERLVIESHVTKGVELLTQLSSVPKEVIEDVRHHHERFDGKGYPDGLKGASIPLGARIISVCDAVDAMLSDRPYRKGLDLDTVRGELERYKGIQFDPFVVETLVRSDALEVHASKIGVRAPRAETGPMMMPSNIRPAQRERAGSLERSS